MSEPTQVPIDPGSATLTGGANAPVLKDEVYVPPNPTKDDEDHPFVILHLNRAGHAFATRVVAQDFLSAEKVVTDAHTDNTVLGVLWDEGSTKVSDYVTVPVVDIDNEP